MIKSISTIKTKRGAASLFVVIFTIILLGVIVLGFTRLILSEAGQTTNSDLSQSAYDSALTGIEDAKVALLKYHDCLSQGYTASASADKGTCPWYIYAMQSGMNKQSCDVVSDVLSRSTANDDGGEVVVQETQNTSDAGNADYMSQAYTCVTIQEELNDYRSSVSSTSRVRIVPIRVGGTKSDGSPYGLDDIAAIRLQWHIPTGDESLDAQREFAPAGDSIAKNPAVLGVQFFQADQTFYLSELSAASANGKTDRAMIYLKPSTAGDNRITKSEMSASANKAQDYEGSANGEPHLVKCQPSSDSEFYCSVTIEIPATFRGENRNQGASFFLVTLPYGQPQTDFSIELLENADSLNSTVPLSGVQARIDSTGRANDLYRRVESRVELVDTYFPYPEFTIQMTGGADSNIEKSFWVTNNCWYSDNGEKKSCGTSDPYDANKSINSAADSSLSNL